MSRRAYEDGEINPKAVTFALSKTIEMAKNRAQFILIWTAIFTFLAFAYALSLPTLYVVKSAIVTEAPGKKLVGLDTALSRTPILQSHAIAELVIRKLNLTQDPEFSGQETALTRLAYRFGLVKPSFQPEPLPSSLFADDFGSKHLDNAIISNFLGRLEVVRRDDTLIISFRSRDRRKAQRISHAVAQSYLEEQIAINISAATARKHRVVDEAILRLHQADAHLLKAVDIASEPVAPRRIKIAAIGTSAGLILSLAMALMLKFLKLTRPEASGARARIGADHLALIPTVSLDPHLPGNIVKSLRYILAAPSSPFAKAIRGLSVELDRRRLESGSQVILLASATTDDSNSMVASNLAHHFALTGLQTIIVDFNVQRQTISNAFLPKRDAGLVEVLTRRALLSDVIYTDATSGISLLPASAQHTAPLPRGEALESTAVAELFSSLRREFDVIVLDSLPIQHVNARILARYANQIAFVMDWNSARRHRMRDAIAYLSAYGERLAGVIVNQVNTDSKLGFSLPKLDRRQAAGVAPAAA